jgi:hypothetical protein
MMPFLWLATINLYVMNYLKIELSKLLLIGKVDFLKLNGGKYLENSALSRETRLNAMSVIILP